MELELSMASKMSILSTPLVGTRVMKFALVLGSWFTTGRDKHATSEASAPAVDTTRRTENDFFITPSVR